MIYTVTFNPSLDYVMKIDHIKQGEVNRSSIEAIYPGGKGINVSLVLSALGLESKALGFTAGFTGKEIERYLEESGCYTDFIRLKTGITRINVKIKSKLETDINATGPEIDEGSLNQMINKLDSLESDDILVLAGSIPAGVSDDIYERILGRLEGRDILFVVDATGKLLLNVLKYRPFLIKPNIFELSELFGVKIETGEEAAIYAKKLIEAGAQNVLVSMGADGAVLAAADGKIYRQSAPCGKAVNTVGSGDSMVAGFICGWCECNSYETALKYGIAAGSASAFCEWLADGEQIKKLIREN